MKFAVVVLACFVAAAQAQRGFSGFGSGFGRQPQRQPFRAATPYKPAPAVVVQQVAAPVSRAYGVADARSAEVLKYGNDVNGDGSYNYFYETNNGIAAQEQGVPRNFGGNPPVAPAVAQGSFSWTSPEGVPVAISYVADENGYQPQGDAIPTPPPVPPQIARALEYIARTYRA
ncbi:insect cuticle protein domain-containing protein [Phthorimaea operculella]|nr:insect cuticle protein domain-containing protein [Phthorimaea operculella]